MRIAIVNDLFMAVESLRRIILSVPGHFVAWVARDGVEAVSNAMSDTPDLILMDLIMPNMDGVEATRQIMSKSPCPIVVVTATVGENAAKVFEAMGHGALDAVNIPMMGSGSNAQRSRYTLLRKIQFIAKLYGHSTDSESEKAVRTMRIDSLPRLIVMGSSTGGPGALAGILSVLPEKLGCSIIIIQHVDERFSAGLADWLDAQTPLRVLLAPEGGSPKADTVYVAGTNDHLVIAPSMTFSYTPEPGAVSYRPSVDVFFDSLTRIWPEPGIAILLTGIGKDGARGLADLKKAMWHTIVQDKESSVVYGMPKAAVELDAANEILPVGKIGAAICTRIDSMTSDDAANRRISI